MEKQNKKAYQIPTAQKIIIDKSISITMISPGGNPPGHPTVSSDNHTAYQNPYKA